MVVPNDTRGWIMTCVSGIACMFGSSVICVDLIVQRIPGKRKWRIQDSSAFLSASLSLSFGVMMFSSLFSMLPSAQNYFHKGGLSLSSAAWATIGSFLGGVLGIQVVSRLLHHYIPSHVVDCEHSHEEEYTNVDLEEAAHKDHEDHLSTKSATEATPLISRVEPDHQTGDSKKSHGDTIDRSEGLAAHHAHAHAHAPSPRRPTLQHKLSSRVSTFVAGTKASCDEGGPCYGYTDPCGRQCLKTLNRSQTRSFGRLSSVGPAQPHSLLRTATGPRGRARSASRGRIDEESPQISPSTTFYSGPTSEHHEGHDQAPVKYQASHHDHSPPRRGQYVLTEPSANGHAGRDASIGSAATSPDEQAHHHHVAENAFMSIGLQTSIAIALHKLPEGFITYATNHANPQLGFAVFMALFIHNISEGFAMALPLYLAIQSRWKAMFWSSLLGGVTQPLGAGIAALWFRLAATERQSPGELVYGCMFSITSGIMASVALQLFSQSLMLTHNRNVCILFAFIGMGILGASRALTVS